MVSNQFTLSSAFFLDTVSNTNETLKPEPNMTSIDVVTSYEPLDNDPYDFTFSDKLNNDYLLYIEGLIKSNLGPTIKYDWNADGPAPALPASSIPTKLS